MLILTKKLVRIFNHIVVVIPLLMASFFAVIYLCGGWGLIIEGHTPDFYFLKNITNLVPCIKFSMLWIVLIAIILVGILKTQRYISNGRLKKLYVCAVVFIIAFAIRFFLLYMYSEDLVPFSDFSASWERAKGNIQGGNINYYSLFPAYLNFSLYENLIINIFGERYIWVLYLNAFYSGITASTIYLIVYEISDKESVCILAGIIYALYPTNIIYIMTGTPEFISILFNTFGVWMAIRVIREDELRHKCGITAIGGILLGIGSSFKTFSIVMVIAFIMVMAASLIITRPEELEKKMMLTGMYVLLMIVGYKVSSEVILQATSKYFNMEISTKTAVPHFLLIGLNTEGEGQIHIGNLSRLYNIEYLTNGMDYEAAKRYAYLVLKEDWSTNSGNIFPNFIKKMIWAWQDDYIPVYYFLEQVGISPDTPMKTFVYEFIIEYGIGVTEIIYLAIMLFAIVGGFTYARLKEINFRYEYIVLIIFGYFCMIFLSEGQSRYKCLVMGYVIIVSSFGAGTLKDISFWIKNQNTGRKINNG